VLLSFFQNNPNIESGHGIDLAEKMLKIGRHKISQKGLNAQIILKHGDATKIPFENHEFDAVSIAFGIRNVESPLQVLREMYRTLNQGGRALILEFSLPNNSIVRQVHLFYLRFILPVLGGFISGHFKAYKYLNKTIETFPYGDDFCEMMMIVGFKKVKAKPLLWGVATIYQGDKE